MRESQETYDRRRLVAFGVVAALGVAWYGTSYATGSRSAQHSYALAGFDHVVATGDDDITIVAGPAPSIVASGPSNRVEALDLHVEGNTLTIGHRRHGWSWRLGWGDSEPAHVAITMPSLLGVKLAGAGDMTIDRVTAPGFTAAVAGSGNLDLTAVDSPSLVLGVTGSGDITAAGKCGAAKLSIVGSGDLELGDLNCTILAVDVAGSGDVEAHATQVADVRIAGTGDVTIGGGARCQSHLAGSGSVSCE